jgi:hypothetical protein
MSIDPHERARFLLSEDRIAEISPKDALWVRGHIAACAECARYDGELKAVVRGIRSFAFDVDPSMNGYIERAIAVRRRKGSSAPRWAMAAAGLVLATAVPVYKHFREVRQEKDDAILIDRVENRLWRAVPVAMEPLVQFQPEESQ